MARVIALLVTCLVGVASVSAEPPAPQNLLRNGGLEQLAPGGLPEGFGKGTGTAWFDDLRLEESPAAREIAVTAKRLQHDPISPLIYGNFMELLSDLVPAMWAEMLDGTSFEYLRTPEERKLHRARVSFAPSGRGHANSLRAAARNGYRPVLGCPEVRRGRP